MACQFEIYLRPGDRRFVPAAHDALDEVDRLEQQMSIYREDSELSCLNRSAFCTPVPVEARLYQLLRMASDIGLETGGAFDITTGPLIRCWGFYQRNGRLPSDEELTAAYRVTGWEGVVFDDERHSIAFRKSGMELNLGSIGKGYALDRLTERLHQAGLHDFLVHAGHSSILAAGNSDKGPGWEVSIRDPRHGEGSLGSIKLMNQGLSTSGTGQQFFLGNGRRFGHILDPRTGWPCQQTLSCSVLAPTASQAEALSTAFFIMTDEEIRRYSESHPDIGMVKVPSPEEATGEEPIAWGMSLLVAEVCH